MKLSVKNLVVFGMLGALMYASKVAMEWLPNVHLLGMFTITFTVVYRRKALYPLYVYVFACGVFNGFATWWVPHLYLWTVLWAVTMLLPRHMPKPIATVVYATVCGLHGLLYGVLYAPTQALLYGLDFEATLAWIAAGLPFDVVHAVGNAVCGLLIVPLVALLRRLERLA